MPCINDSLVISVFAVAIAALAPAMFIAGLEAKSAVALRLSFASRAAQTNIKHRAIFTQMLLHVKTDKIV